MNFITDLTWDSLPLVHSPGSIIPVSASLLYLLMLISLPKHFASRDPWNVSWILPYWNLMLFLGSLGGAVVYLYIVLERHWGTTYYEIICDPSGKSYDGLFGFMAWGFLLSKFVEFGDTVFIIVKKRPIDFLHWYHHLTVMLYTWASVANRNSLGQWFGLINAWVHSFMYYYYWRVSLGQRIWWGKILTVMQTAQMGVGLVLLWSWVRFWQEGKECGSEDPIATVVAGVVMYGSYLVLFVRFYIHRYWNTKKKEGGEGGTGRKTAHKEE